MITCAIYTRKSTENGLDVEYNSLDAQADACRAYIESQRHANWTCMEEAFEDRGISGGSLDRPALHRLLQKVRNGEVGVVVVHKVDRLTRSLSDFAKLAELFDKHGVSFVSVTQHLDTSTSLGRLSLNVLLSFAQFEREIASERIKDKIHAAKQRGLWTGGRVPLGYRSVDKKLVVDPSTAPTVREIFTRYLELGNVTDLLFAWRSGKSTGDLVGGPRNDIFPKSLPKRGAVYAILRNPVYLGKVRCGDQLVDGAHKPIIEPALWQAVQARLQQKRTKRRPKSETPLPAALLGKVFDISGGKLTRSHTRKKNGTRFAYYVSADSTRNTRKQARIRIPCSVLEDYVTDRMDIEINDIQKRINWAERAALPSKVLAKIAQWEAPKDRQEQKVLAFSLVERIEIGEESAKITYCRKKLLHHIAEDGQIKIPARIARASFIVASAVLFSRSRKGGCKLIQQKQTDEQIRDDGKRWFALLATGKAKDMYEIAAMYGVSQATVSRKISKALQFQ